VLSCSGRDILSPQAFTYPVTSRDGTDTANAVTVVASPWAIAASANAAAMASASIRLKRKFIGFIEGRVGHSKSSEFMNGQAVMYQGVR
jgi:hypothetical protein